MDEVPGTASGTCFLFFFQIQSGFSEQSCSPRFLISGLLDVFSGIDFDKMLTGIPF
jgi:hypothetical protein